MMVRSSRVIRWKKLGLASVNETWNANERRIYCYVNRMVEILPDVLYSYDMDMGMNQPERIEITEERTPADPLPSKYGIRRDERSKILKEDFK